MATPKELNIRGDAVPPPAGAKAESAFRSGLEHLRVSSVDEARRAFEAAAAAGHLEARFNLGTLAAREARRRPAARDEAILHFETILRELDSDAQGEVVEFDGIERVWFALGHLQADEPSELSSAIKSFREGLRANPLSSAGHLGLGQLLLETGQGLGALGEFKVAIQLDPDFRPTYHHLARLLIGHLKSADLPQEYEQMIQEFGDQAPQVLATLSMELLELGREQAQEGMHTKGHQLKNLMGLAGSRLRTLSRKLPPTAEGSEELAAIAEEQERIYGEWVGYLDAMRPETVRPVLFEPAALVNKVADAVSQLAESRGSSVRFQVRVQSGVPAIEADERMLQEAVTNLCLNAVEALGDEPGQIQLGLGFDDDQATLFIEVEDDGPGIEEEPLKRIFEPGYTTKEKGNGYGLSIARRLIQAHRGQLRAKSRPGHGSVFRVDIPINFDTATFSQEPESQNLKT